MTYGYIRVSSDKQTVENQRFERPARRGCFICQDRQYTESEQGHRAALLPYFF